MAGVIFRPAAHSDEPVLLRMMRNLAEQEPGPYFFDEPTVRDVLRKFLASPDLGQVWIFFEEETPVGYIVLTFGYSFEYHGRDSFIDELYIEPQYRRKGIGRRHAICGRARPGTGSERHPSRGRSRQRSSCGTLSSCRLQRSFPLPDDKETQARQTLREKPWQRQLRRKVERWQLKK